MFLMDVYNDHEQKSIVQKRHTNLIVTLRMKYLIWNILS